MPILPATGSIITAAILLEFPSTSLMTESRSLNFACSVCSTKDAGTPGESGIPKVIAPDPACTSKGSTLPW